MGRGRRLALVAITLLALGAAPATAAAQDDGPDGEVVELLQQLIRTNTSNPPGNKQQIAETIYVPTIVNGGFRSNVLPGSAEATVNIRHLPGARPRPAIRELKRVIGDKRVVVTPIGTTGETTTQTLDRFDKRAEQPPTSTDSDLYRALAREGKAQWPTGRVRPALFEAGTDAVPWREKGIPVYGIYPYPISRAELEDMHGNDEHISIRRLEEGMDMITRVIRSTAAAG